MRRYSSLGSLLVVGGALAASFGQGCGGDNNGTGDGGNGGDGSCAPFCNPFSDAQGADVTPCTNLCLKQVNCGGSTTTTVSGVVYDPAGNLPLYNVAVYVPNAPLDPIVHGATCDKCGSTLSGSPLVATLTDDAGKFTLQNVPVDSNVPLVIQVGKWRRRTTISTVTACKDNPMPAAQTRLATKPAETSPDDDIPFVAISTGGLDALECMIPLIGVDPGQVTDPGKGGRINLYTGVGGSSIDGQTPQTEPWWDDSAGKNLMPYDIVMLSCEGATNPQTKPATALQGMQAYANTGGRVFATHFHYYWIESSPAPWPSTATWNHAGNLQDPFTGLIDQTFPKGVAFAQWMLNVGGSTTLGQFTIHEGRHDVDNVGPPAPDSIQWVYGSPQLTEYYSFNTPVTATADQQCGKVVFSDLHVGAGNNPGGTYPAQVCTQTPTLTPQEKALVFLLFDLSSCVQNDKKQPPPPVN